jgi:hypothetical protein
MTDAIEVSYTGDLLAHRRCARAWCYEKQVGFQPYEAVQAMEGRLVHHAMEWLTDQFQVQLARARHATAAELQTQLDHYWRVLWARGIRTRFGTKDETLRRIVENLYPRGNIDSIVRAVVEGAVHTEYELRAVKKVLPAAFGGKSRILLTGILDLVIQQAAPLIYPRRWSWSSKSALAGQVASSTVTAHRGDMEIWDYKGTRASTPYIADYVRQLLTYAALYRDRTGSLPERCVLFFINEPKKDHRLLAIEVDDSIVDRALDWTQDQVRELRATTATFERDPLAVVAGDRTLSAKPLGKRVTAETVQQCTGCAFRFDCDEYRKFLGPATKSRDVDIYTVFKN